MADPAAPWQPEAAASYLDFLSDDHPLLPDLLDPQTLSAVCTADPAAAGPLPNESAKRRFMEAQQDSDNSDDDEGGGKGGGKGGEAGSKRPKAETNTAARNKACREKARREKINERLVP